MAKQIYDWGKVDYGDIISFRYPSEGGMILNTVLVLQPYFIQTTKDGLKGNYLSGLKLEVRGNVPTVRNRTLLYQILLQIGEVELISYEDEIYRVNMTNPSQAGAKIIYEKIKSDIKALGIYRTYNLDKAKKARVFLESIDLPRQVRESLRPEEPEVEEPEVEETDEN